MIVVPFLPIHLDSLDLIEEMGFMKPYLVDRKYAEFIDDSNSYSCSVDGKIIACGGVLKLDETKMVAWALMGKETTDYMVQITRAVKDFFSKRDDPRIEIHVNEKFDIAHRWAKMLGFDCETPNGMKNWSPQGETYYLYARTK